MHTMFSALLNFARAVLVPRAMLAVENAALRLQLAVYVRTQKRPKLKPADRISADHPNSRLDALRRTGQHNELVTNDHGVGDEIVLAAELPRVLRPPIPVATRPHARRAQPAAPRTCAAWP